MFTDKDSSSLLHRLLDKLNFSGFTIPRLFKRKPTKHRHSVGISITVSDNRIVFSSDVEIDGLKPFTKTEVSTERLCDLVVTALFDFKIVVIEINRYLKLISTEDGKLETPFGMSMFEIDADIHSLKCALVLLNKVKANPFIIEYVLGLILRLERKEKSNG